jgi:ferritin-like metal-binding protein YciE
MTDQDIRKYGEIQYLKGRLDELNKALPTVFNMERQRKLDQRIEKYLQKLKKVDEIAFHLYQVELINRARSKEKSKQEIKQLLEDVLSHDKITDEELIKRITNQIESY